MQIELPHLTRVLGVVTEVTPRAANGRMAFSLRYSEDAAKASWTPLAFGGFRVLAASPGSPGSNRTTTLFASPVFARAVRLYPRMGVVTSLNAALILEQNLNPDQSHESVLATPVKYRVYLDEASINDLQPQCSCASMSHGQYSATEVQWSAVDLQPASLATLLGSGLENCGQVSGDSGNADMAAAMVRLDFTPVVASGSAAWVTGGAWGACELSDDEMKNPPVRPGCHRFVIPES